MPGDTVVSVHEDGSSRYATRSCPGLHRMGGKADLKLGLQDSNVWLWDRPW